MRVVNQHAREHIESFKINRSVRARKSNTVASVSTSANTPMQVLTPSKRARNNAPENTSTMNSSMSPMDYDEPNTDANQNNDQCPAAQTGLSDLWRRCQSAENDLGEYLSGLLSLRSVRLLVDCSKTHLSNCGPSRFLKISLPLSPLHARNSAPDVLSPTSQPCSRRNYPRERSSVYGWWSTTRPCRLDNDEDGTFPFETTISSSCWNVSTWTRQTLADGWTVPTGLTKTLPEFLNVCVLTPSRWSIKILPCIHDYFTFYIHPNFLYSYKQYPCTVDTIHSHTWKQFKHIALRNWTSACKQKSNHTY